MELKKLEEHKAHRDQFDQAVARIAGEFIIDHVEKTIENIYREVVEEERSKRRREEEIRLAEIQKQIEMEKEK